MVCIVWHCCVSAAWMLDDSYEATIVSWWCWLWHLSWSYSTAGQETKATSVWRQVTHCVAFCVCLFVPAVKLHFWSHFVWFQANNMRWINNFVVILISAVIRTCQPALFEYIRHLSAGAPAVCSWQQWMQCPEELMAGEPLWGLRGCKNWRAPFPGRMSYKATKPVVYLSMFYCIVVY